MTTLNILVVNHCHPQRQHVCATRLGRFAERLSLRGHKVVLLTESWGDDPSGPSVDAVKSELAQHSPDEGPLVIGVRCRQRGILAKAREGKLPAVLRKPLLAGAYLLCGSPFHDWVQASKPYWGTIAHDFKPGVVWGSFGNTGVLAIAQGIARASNCPWVLDMKDNWNRFVPGPVQGVVAQRFRDAAAITALSCAHANVVRDVFAQEATVLYSGFDRAAPSPADGEVNQTPVLTLTGDLVDAEARRVLADGVKAWLAKTHGGIVLRYFGRDQDGLSELQRLLDERCLVENAGYKPVPELLRAFKDADANVYFHNPRVLFHHKVFELLSAAKPIICIPDESGEVKAIVKEIGGRLYTCSDGESIDKALGDVVARQSVPLSIHGDELAHYAWDSQSAILEKVFLDVARKEEGA